MVRRGGGESHRAGCSSCSTVEQHNQTGPNSGGYPCLCLRQPRGRSVRGGWVDADDGDEPPARTTDSVASSLYLHASTVDPDGRPILCQLALTNPPTPPKAYLKLDEMLADPEHRQELACLKAGACRRRGGCWTAACGSSQHAACMCTVRSAATEARRSRPTHHAQAASAARSARAMRLTLIWPIRTAHWMVMAPTWAPR